MTGRRHNAHFRRMLIGYDGSPQSEKAVELAFSLAQCVDSTVLVLAVGNRQASRTSLAAARTGRGRTAIPAGIASVRRVGQ
jgi:hypothetical protein